MGVGFESVRKLATGTEPDASWFGIGLAIVSLVVMPLVAHMKRRVGQQLDSRAVTADATETALCVWLSVIVLAGLGLNMLFSWWWPTRLPGSASSTSPDAKASSTGALSNSPTVADRLAVRTARRCSLTSAEPRTQG